MSKEAIAGYLAARRFKPGDDMETLRAACLAEVEADPYYDQFAELTASAPPPEQWDPGKRLAIRRMLREANKTESAG